MEYVIPSLITACGFFFVMWQRAGSDKRRIERRAMAAEEITRVRQHTSQIMRDAVEVRHAKFEELDKKLRRRKKELKIMADSIAKASGPAEVATIWNQEQ